MTTVEELKSKAGWHGHEHISGLLLKAATEIESLQKDLDGLRSQNAELKLEVEECRALLRVASVTAGNLEEQTASLLKDFAVSEKQNAELRECLKVKDEALQSCEFNRSGYRGLDVTQVFDPAKVNKALAAQPEGKP